MIINVFQQTFFLCLSFPTSRMGTAVPTYLAGVMMVMLEQSLAALGFRVGAALPFWLGESGGRCLEHAGGV